MTRKRGTAFRAALIASLAVAFGVGSSALATTPPSEPAGGGGECPRDIAAAAAAATTVPGDHGGAGDDRRGRGTGDDRCRCPGDHRRAAETAPPPTLPENVTELDPSATININPQPRDALQQGGTLRLAVGSLAENWNPQPSGRQRASTSTTSSSRCRTSRGSIDAEGIATLNPDFVLEFTESEDPLDADVHAQPGGGLAQRRSDHRRRLAGRRGTRSNGVEPGLPGRLARRATT